MIGVYQQEGIYFFDVIKQALQKHLKLESHNAGFFTIPSDSYNPLRNQYCASTIIKDLATKRTTQFNLKIGMIDVDIYAHGMNFIFGITDPLKKTAIVSTHRLAGDKITERISKEVVHEIGHLLGLKHCSNPYCVMYFSNTLSDTDNKDIGLCNNCSADIE